MTNIQKIKLREKPIAKSGMFSAFNMALYLTNLYALAANKTGIAKKKENSAASLLDKPKTLPLKIVAALLDTPGISAMH